MNNKQIAAAFREAKARMWTGQTDWKNGEEFLCFALEDTFHPASRAARRIVEQRLGYYSTFYSWLVAQIGKRNLNIAEVQRHKLKWVDLLIEEFGSTKA